ncbi:MAG TPA: heavy-metal-associated domain-containing protein [Spirochaetota bacterium]|nr:heavy-metal-associated domain-containing protein [Spirochaetota bacterium]
MKFLVKDMSCHHCVGRINDALYRLDGVDGVKIDLEHKLVEVSGRASVDAVIDVIKGAGYTAETE